MKQEYWSFHPCDNSVALEFKKEEFLEKFLPSIKRQSVVLDLNQSAPVAVEKVEEKSVKKGGVEEK
jgi:hypothetical protein